MIFNEYRTGKLKEVFSKKFYILFFIFLLYNFLNIFFNKIYVSFATLLDLSKGFLIPFALFNFLIVPSLVALTITLSFIKIKEAFSLKSTGIGFAGLFGGIMGGACPGCLVGLFPAILGIFGISASLSSLPFYGLEIQLFSSILLVWAIFLLTKSPVCEIPLKESHKSL